LGKRSISPEAISISKRRDSRIAFEFILRSIPHCHRRRFLRSSYNRLSKTRSSTASARDGRAAR
jgi:hypothetical protein